jgi:hypothetical protein
VDTNDGTGASNGEINILSNLSGGLSGVTVDGNIVRNGVSAPVGTVSNIAHAAGAWTITLSGAGINLANGQFIYISGVTCTGAGCYNGEFLVNTGGGNPTTSFTITNGATPTYSSGGIVTWGTCSGNFALGGTAGHNAGDTGCFEGIQVSRNVPNVTIVNNQLTHVNSEGIVVSIGPTTVGGNILNQVGENGPGVGGILFGGTQAALMNSVVITGNTITDAPYGISVNIGAAGAVNQVIEQADIEHNIVAVNTGFPTTSIGIQLKNAGSAATAILSDACAAGTCTVAMSANQSTCATGQTWSVRNVTGSTGGSPASFNGDFVLTGATNDGSNHCTQIQYSGSTTGTAGLAVTPLAYMTHKVNTLIIAHNDFGGAGAPLALWAASNLPSGFIDLHDNKLAIPQTFQDVAGPEPNYGGGGNVMHRVTSGHRIQFPGVSGAVGATNVLDYNVGSTKMISGYVSWSIEAIDAAGSNLCTLAGETYYSGENTGGTFVTQVNTTAPAAAACTATQTLSVTWTVVGGGGHIIVKVNPNALFAPLGFYRMFYEVHNLCALDPAYVTNPPNFQ